MVFNRNIALCSFVMRTHRAAKKKEEEHAKSMHHHDEHQQQLIEVIRLVTFMV